MASLAELVDVSASPMVLYMPGPWMTDSRFAAFCQANRDWRLERTADGHIVIMPPASSETGYQNFDLGGQLYKWARAEGTGRAFDSSAGFKLPNGAIRSPDASWIPRDRIGRLTPRQKHGFWQICPDFVVELRSAHDRLGTLQDKMVEYLENGARLGWLIDPLRRDVYVYKAGAELKRWKHPKSLSGDPVLRGFVLDLKEIWDPDL